MYNATHNPEIVIGDRYHIDKVITDTPKMAAMRAIDLQTEEAVFVKSRNPRLDRHARVRVSNEADILGSVDHPSVPGLHYADPDADRPYIVTDLVEGGDHDLKIIEWLEEPGDLHLAADIGVSLLRTLDAVHELDITHCDIKPGNVLPRWSGKIALTDFDIARRHGVRPVNFDNPDEQGASTIGTLQYMSPEQLRAEPIIGQASDIYSAGLLIRYLTSGKPPVEGMNANHLLLMRMGYQASRDMLAHEVPDEIEAIIDKALQERPEDRYWSAGEMAEDLAGWRYDNTPRANRDELIAA